MLRVRNRLAPSLLVVSVLMLSMATPDAYAEMRRASVRVVDGVLRYVARPGIDDDVLVGGRPTDAPLTSVLLQAKDDMRAGEGCRRLKPLPDSDYRFRVKCLHV